MARPPLLVAVLVSCISVAAITGTATSASRRAAPERATPTPRTQTIDLPRRIDVNRLNMFVTNIGSFGFDLISGNSGLYYPKGEQKTALFAGGLWLGTGEPTRVTIAEYSMEYGPGRILVPGIWEDANMPELIVYKVTRWTGNPADSAHLEHTPEEIAADPTLDPLVHHSWSEYLAGAAARGAPVRLYRLPLTDTPAPDDSIDVLGPDVTGDRMLWSVFNDADPAHHTNIAGHTTPLEYEVHHTTFGFDRPGPLGDVVFMRYQIIHRGTTVPIDHIYPGIWTDPDLGAYADDLVGSDVGRNMGFCYNADPLDDLYGSNPPAVGIRMLGGPIYAFKAFINGTDPQSPEDAINYLKGLNADGSEVFDPVAQATTRFMYPGDPVSGSGWLDTQAADKRMLVTAPRFLPAAPGETTEVVVAVVMGQDTDHLSAISELRCNSDFAQQSYASGFDLLDPPPDVPPCVTSSLCGRPLDFWQEQCTSGGIGSSNLQGIAQAADGQSTYFTWLFDAANMCATLQSTGTDLRSQAEREYAALLANVMAGRFGIEDEDGKRIFMSSIAGVSCPGVPGQTVGDLMRTGYRDSLLTSVTYVNANPTNSTALAGINFGLPHFGGGAGYAFDFLGSSLDPNADPAPFRTVHLRFSTIPQKIYRYLRHERASDGAAPPLGRRYTYAGYHEVPIQVWDVDRDVPLEAAFVERVRTDDDGTILPPGSQLATFDSTWAPDASDLGGREYFTILATDYVGSPNPYYEVDGFLTDGLTPALYALAARLQFEGAIADPGDFIRFLWNRPIIESVDQRMIDLESQSIANPEVQDAYAAIVSCLANLNATCDKPTSVMASLVHATARSTEVELEWYAPGLTSAHVQRIGPGSEWETLAEVARDGRGMIGWIDRAVTGGERYGYRLRDGADQTYAETWVEVPSTHALTLAGARPHPAGNDALVAFTLARRAPARLDVIDIAGRRVATREVGTLGPGSHSVRIAELNRLPAGVYLLRLEQGGRAVTARMVRIR